MGSARKRVRNADSFITGRATPACIIEVTNARRLAIGPPFYRESDVVKIAPCS
jgi:hypothetical protein